MRLYKLGAAALTYIPTPHAVLTTATVITPLAISGCSSNLRFNEIALNKSANDRAIYHVNLAKLYDDIVTAVAKEIDNQKIIPESKMELLEWNQKLNDSRKELFKAFDTNSTDDIIEMIKKLDGRRPTKEQEKAHYDYRVTATRAYFEGSSLEIFNHSELSKIFKSFDVRFEEFVSDDTERPLRESSYYWDETKHKPVPWGYRKPIGTVFGDYGELISFEGKPTRYFAFGEKEDIK